RYLLCGLRKDDGGRGAFPHTCVVFIKHQIFGTVQNSIAPRDLSQLIDHCREAHRTTPSLAPPGRWRGVAGVSSPTSGCRRASCRLRPTFLPAFAATGHAAREIPPACFPRTPASAARRASASPPWHLRKWNSAPAF